MNAAVEGAGGAPASAPLMAAVGLAAGYEKRPLVHDFDLEVRPGEVVVLLGPNGAGKTTTLLTLAGVLKPIAGTVSWAGRPASRPLHRRARQGLSFISEERSIFARLTVRQNLSIARGCDPSRAGELFPELVPLMERRAALLSGGEQQMLTLARALGRPTRLLLADELSLGLAPTAINRLLRAVRVAADEGMGALLVEQHVHRALEIADRILVMRNGRVLLACEAEDGRRRIDEIRALYIGSADEASRSTSPSK
ncbi:MAG: ATP-binding cassette domain-containing protein [Actinobacteria bacterium]|nr:ATP-binding cassette domain-containing protein [Actinomycetota bacterium]